VAVVVVASAVVLAVEALAEAHLAVAAQAPAGNRDQY
jgi:hypothetical protein